MSSRQDNNGRKLHQGESYRQDGRYMFRQVDKVTKKRRTIYANTLVELRKKEKQLIVEQMQGNGITHKKVKLNDIFDVYICSRKISTSTLVTYKYLWNTHVRHGLGEMYVQNIQGIQIQNEMNNLSKRGYSDGTLKFLCAILKNCFSIAIENDLVLKNPATKIASKYGKETKEKNVLSMEEQESLLTFVKYSEQFKEYYPMLVIMLYTGCRMGEIIGLTWSNVDMLKREIAITQQLIYKDYGDGSKFHLKSPKSKSGNRKIPMCEEVYQAFQNQKVLVKMLQIKPVPIDGINDFVFLGSTGKPRLPDVINCSLERIVKRYNNEEINLAFKQNREPRLLPHLSSHSLRHTFCTRMAENNVTVKTMQYIMGHSNSNITLDIYTHVQGSSQVKAEMRKISKFGVKVVSNEKEK